MFFVVGFLNGSAAVGFGDGFVHGIGHVVCVHEHVTFAVSGSSSDGLDEGGFGTEETFFVCIQDCYQSDLRDVQAFSKEVDSYQYIKDIQTHITDNAGTF